MNIRYADRLFNGERTSGLPLFDWALRQRRVFPRSYAGKVLERRLRVSPARAELLANLSGLGGRE